MKTKSHTELTKFTEGNCSTSWRWEKIKHFELSASLSEQRERARENISQSSQSPQRVIIQPAGAGKNKCVRLEVWGEKKKYLSQSAQMAQWGIIQPAYAGGKNADMKQKKGLEFS